jgi:uncharacterized protein YbaR (Trm112 family)
MDWKIKYLKVGMCPKCKGDIVEALYLVEKEELPENLYLRFISGEADVFWCPNCSVFFVSIPPEVFELS